MTPPTPITGSAMNAAIVSGPLVKSNPPSSSPIFLRNLLWSPSEVLSVNIRLSDKNYVRYFCVLVLVHHW